MGKDINESKLIGGKKKNGHKLNCSCHICENMKNKARRGGYQEEVEKEQEKMMGGSKKKNGHRQHCQCPICKNMKNSKKIAGSKYGRKTKKRRGGDDNNDGYEEEKSDEQEEKEEIEPYDEDEDEEIKDDEHEEVKKETKGGKKKKKGNGHKSNCKCPICKNIRKKKGGEPVNNISKIESETKASEEDYEALDALENGKVGGTRKKHKRGKKNFRKTKKSYKSN